MTKWTDEQKLAIDKENQNIIVSAGAGSGKTAVLTERVIRKLKSGINIDELLILTFTNKAASEMKDRIRNAIKSNEKIKNQLDYIDSCYISTFDSFSLSIVKKYSYLLNISNNVNIADSSIIYLEKKKIIDDIFDKKYQENNASFIKMIDYFTLKKDDTIKELILNINNDLDLKYDKINYLNNYISNYYNEDFVNRVINEYEALLISKEKEIDRLLTDFSYTVDTDFFYDYKSKFNNLLSSNNYENIKNSLDFESLRLSNKSEEEAKEIKENIKELLDELKELTRFESIKELKETYFSTKEFVNVIIEIIIELDERISKAKKELNIYDFIDISKMGIKLLKENKIVCEELKNKFKEIMIDEYQDTSDLQEEFISLIANNNVYMVGDIKQSIYRFRNANPYLFKEKYDNYSKNIGGYKIDLTNNFRSRKEVVDSINTIFSKIMTDNVGGADYSKSHKMFPGNQDYLENGKTDQSNNLEIYNYEYDKSCGFSKQEIEIFFIAQDIKNKVDNKYKIFDKKSRKLREVNYNDFTILLDRSSYFDLYKNIFQYFGIPLTKNSTTNLIEENEIYIIKNIIKLIINYKEQNFDIDFKYAFMSVARSYLFEMNDEEIFDHIANNDFSSKILDKILQIVNELDSISLSEIIYEIIDLFDFYSKIILVGDIESRINRLTSIIKIFENLSNINYTIYDLYDYLNNLIEDKYKIEVKEQDSISNSVKIMTIHASKGLEYPICYFASFHLDFNTRDKSERFAYSKDYGIILPYFKEGIGATFVKELMKEKYDNEEISEKIRLLYVALTRAREKMIIVTELGDKKIRNIKSSKNFLDFLIYSKNEVKDNIISLDISKLNLTKDYNLIKKTNYKESISKTNDKINIKEITIDNSLLSKEKISKETKKLLSKDVKNAMKFGTLMHEVLELIDFRNPNYDVLKIDNYYIDKVKNFISKIYTKNLINIYKEYEFLYEEDNTVFHGIIDLILEYQDKIMIIDYKLNNVDDDNYVKQLNNYKNYLSKKTNKKIDIYLFSIISGEFSAL